MQQRLPILIVLLLVVVAGVILVMNRDTEEDATATPVPTQTAEAVATTPVEGAVTVTLGPDGFSSQEINVATGQSVRFLNESGSPAIFASDPHPQHTNYSELESESVADGDSYLFVFDKAGRFGMHNHLNPGQTTTVIVK